MASPIAPTAPSADDADQAAEDVIYADAPDASPTDANISPERWLHSETVDELRRGRARQGLPVPRSLKSVPRPPFTAPSEPFVAVAMPSRILVVRAESHVARLGQQFGPIAQATSRWVRHTSSVLVAFVASYLSTIGERLRNEQVISSIRARLFNGSPHS